MSWEWLKLLRCPSCPGPIRHDGPGFRCADCGTTYPAAGNAPDFLSRARDMFQGAELDYDYHLRRRKSSLRHLYNKLRRPIELELIKREADRLGRTLDVLDVGCGDPTRPKSYHARILPLTRVYIGVEPSLSIVARVHPLPPIGLVRASGELRVVRDEVVDIALCLGALDRCVDPYLVLANMAAALRPGGCTLIDLVNRDVWHGVAARLLGTWNGRPVPGAPRRRWEMSPNDLKRSLELVGLRDVRIQDLLYLMGLLRSPGFDWAIGLFGQQRCLAVLRGLDRIGRLIAPGRGGMFIALARKQEQ